MTPADRLTMPNGSAIDCGITSDRIEAASRLLERQRVLGIVDPVIALWPDNLRGSVGYRALCEVRAAILADEGGTP